jgi:tetratricopeptide (TPR) repeat protein
MSTAPHSGSLRLRILLVGLLVAVETAYFGSQCVGALARLNGKRAYFDGDSVRAWSLLDRATTLGADRIEVLTDRAEVLLFGLDQQGLGAKPDLPLPAEQIPSVARGIVSSILSATPYRAYAWSLAADVFTDEALALRRSTPLDLSTLSDNPIANLLPQEWMLIAALQEAARRDPRNYLYDDLLSEQFGQWGLADQAAPHVRRSVSLYPVLEGHVYLSRPRLEEAIIEAAVAGFDDALRGESMVPADAIQCDAGRFLVMQGRNTEAMTRFRAALGLNPDNPDAVYWYGYTSYLLEDYPTAAEYLARASLVMPDEAYHWFQLGQTYLKLGRRAEATEALRKARELDGHSVSYFHALASVLEEDGSTKEAERQYQAAASLNPRDNSAWRALLGFYQRHPERDEAARQVCTRLRRSRIPEEIYKDACGAAVRIGP